MQSERLSGAKAAGHISPMPTSILPLKDGIRGGQRWFAMPSIQFLHHKVQSPPYGVTFEMQIGVGLVMSCGLPAGLCIGYFTDISPALN